MFEKYGEIRSIILQRDHETGLPRGVAFVNFTEESSAVRALEELNGEDFKSRTLRIQHPMRRR